MSLFKKEPKAEIEKSDEFVELIVPDCTKISYEKRQPFIQKQAQKVVSNFNKQFNAWWNEHFDDFYLFDDLTFRLSSYIGACEAEVNTEASKIIQKEVEAKGYGCIATYNFVVDQIEVSITLRPLEFWEWGGNGHKRHK